MTPRKSRKMPKNQRAYPKGKPRMTPISDHHELAALYEGRDQIGVPQVVRLHEGEDNWSVNCYVNAAELKKWRALRNPTSNSDVA